MSVKETEQQEPRRFRDEAAGTSGEEERAARADAPAQNSGTEESAGLEERSGEGFDYIVPDLNKKKRKKRKKSKSRSSHGSTTRSAAKEEMDEAAEGYVFAEPHITKRHRVSRRSRGGRRMAAWKKALIAVFSVILALAVAAVGTLLVMREIGRRSMQSSDDFEVVTPDEDESGNDIIHVDNSGRVITYDGVSYEYNKDLISVVFLGVADDETGEGLYMVDAIYILTVDTQTGKVKILSVSRDTMTDVDVYSVEGRYIDTERRQLSYAYSYGSDAVTGGKNTEISLSRLFYGLPFDNYFAIDMDALMALNDSVGGVTLESMITFASPYDGHTIYEGETVTLRGHEAKDYVTMRDIEQLDSNNNRMQRQQQYIRAFIGSVLPAVKQDISVVSELYGQITADSETSLDISKLVYIASTVALKLNSASDIEYVSLSGEITAGEHAEMNVSNETAVRTMLDVFYRPLAQVPDMNG